MKSFVEANFPAQFIAEGLDQTRGWFYTLMVLSTALFDKPAWKNVIVNGLVLAEDGKKMSKRLKNYPDPQTIIDKYGADSVRLYLINSPVVRAEPLRFKWAGVHGVLKGVFIPWYNAYRFRLQNIKYWETKTGEAFRPSQEKALSSTNVMDRWLLVRFLSNWMTDRPPRRSSSASSAEKWRRIVCTRWCLASWTSSTCSRTATCV